MFTPPQVGARFGECNGGCSSGVERLTVAQEVAGSKPVTHPRIPLASVGTRKESTMTARPVFVLLFMVTALAPNAAAALPISPTTTITVGDKLFDNFVFFVAEGLCCPPPFDVSDISVAPLVSADGSHGLRFEGPFSKPSVANGGQPWLFTIFYDAATLDSSSRFDGSRLA